MPERVSGGDAIFQGFCDGWNKWEGQWDLRPDGTNPCRHVKRFREEKRERFLSDIEYQRLGAALKEIEVDGTQTASAIARSVC